ncbi:sigma-70 family RNA polymerase sigma factor [Tautonia plasticadhaerens]|uniref:ECF RNA polymerase sigma factor SigM n=1 Tax=Tautonia plasticadhaerens TaxID=2527974 RepID=A0A518HEC4_9BACT|nr:sigma-70 family RNA polymerase sigma factor [Tautonia plasticadhaerens]QDV39200.1 ECF RNA polymerase sigma factor SigM [Tautonia plasticadhaerens]
MSRSNAITGAALRHLRSLYDSGGVAGLTDAELLDRFAADPDEADFAALVDRHGPMVLATCRGVLRDPHDADDAFQATFLVLARRSGSLRVAGGSVGGWLHGVALRVDARARAERARRSSREGTATVPVEVADVDDRARRVDLLDAVHVEIGRLPSRCRGPVVLCYLEGRTHAQAAAALGRGEATVRRRLAEARELLKARLGRRGLAPAAGLAALLGTHRASAEVRESLATATARAARSLALGRGAVGASASALALAGGVFRAALLARLRATGVAALALGAATWLGIAGAGDLRAGGGPQPEAASRTAASPPTPERPPTANVRPDREPEGPLPSDRSGEGVVRLGGRVVAPDGRPVAGAAVRAILYKPVGGIDEARPDTASRGDGSFTIAVPEGYDIESVPGPAGRALTLLATAEGYGPGWEEIPDRSDAPAEATIRLAVDDVPITGRVVDLEGRPVAGARVRSNTLFRPGDGDALDAWLAAARERGRGPWDGLEGVPFERSWATDADGRFRLDGLGRERLAELILTGPGIAASHLFAMTRDVPAVRAPDPNRVAAPPVVYHGARLDHAAAPAKPIVGVVRDRDTGVPLAGVTIRGRAYEPNNLASAPGVETLSDAEGRYELTGLTRADRYTLFVWPGADRPYPNAILVAEATTPAHQPVPFGIGLARGVVIRGRVTDAATGAPAPAVVSYFASRENPHVDDYPGFRGAISLEPRAETERDGSFALVGLPGRGLLAARSASTRYPRGDGADAIGGLDATNGTFDTVPGTCYSQFYHRIVPVEVASGADAITRDIAFRRGGSVSITAVAPDGEPLDGVRYEIMTDRRFVAPGEVESGSLVIDNLQPGHRRHLILWHPGRGLVGSLLLSGDEHGAMTLGLGPWGVVAGRLVDEDDRLRRGVHLRIIGGEFDPGRGFSTEEFHPDADGRFRIEGLVPGLRYDTYAVHEGRGPLGTAFEDVVVGPGEVKEVGDVVIEPEAP